jgi:hypothetical protein
VVASPAMETPMLGLICFVAVVVAFLWLGCRMTRKPPAPSLVFPWPDDGVSK